MSKKLSASRLAKKAGNRTLSDVSKMTGKHVSTLHHWHLHNPDLFWIVCVGCVAVKGEK